MLRGRGCFVDDINLPGQAYAVLVRSPHANAHIRSINLEPALQSPGVLAVYTGDDVARDGLGTMKDQPAAQATRRLPVRACPQTMTAAGSAMSATRWRW
ncbi:MAG: hypothetical protein IPM01_03495 [Burkholderiaceae bacterium]|nr:hypothetical protein [Burkholderiaceae bacterium]